MKTTGFFGLQTSRDLVEKAGRELERMRADPLVEDHVWNFFTTVQSIPEWIHPGEHEEAKAKVKVIFGGRVELRIARHLGNDAKHFDATHGQNRQVEGTSVQAAFQPTFQADAFQEKTLFVKLDRVGDPETAKFAEWTPVLALAEDVYKIAKSLVS